MRSSGRIAAGDAGAGGRADAAGARARDPEVCESAVRPSAVRAGGREDAAEDLAFVRSGRAAAGVGLAFFGRGAMIPNEVRFGMLEDLRS
jgi:hypothetical protein